MTQIFLSYSRVDLAFVEQLYARLQRMFPDFKLWYDKSPHGLLGGDNWWQAILDAIAESDIFIYILTNESVNSIYCQAEFAEARRLQKRIITIQARDRTEITDSLGDIQFIDMKNGPTDQEAGDQLVASINRQIRLVKKSRPLWKPATARPGKEIVPVRLANTPDVETPPLKPPTQEALSSKKDASGTRTALIVALIGGVFTLVAAGIAILPSMIERADKAATESALNTTQTQIALVLTTSVAPGSAPTGTDTPATPSETPTPTETPTATGTPDLIAAAEELIKQQTAQAIAEAATATAEYFTQEAINLQMAIVNQTATATLWTHTPTPDNTQTVAAILTEFWQGTSTQNARNATATATLWTATPSPTQTKTPIPPSATPTNTPTATPTLSAEQIATTPVAQNAAWTPIERDFDGVAMVLVPAGCFMMGSEEDGDEKPIHEQCFDEPYWIDKYEVTNAQFASFGGVASTSSQWIGGNHPRETITWFEARDFCGLRGSRLPTEREWEYAARGPDNLEYPWGATWNTDNTVWNGNSNAQTADVGSYLAGASWVEAQDMAGNVWEWASSEYKAYPYDGGDGREADISSDTNAKYRVARGSSWFGNDPSKFRAAYRFNYTPSNRSYLIGFRCVRSLNDSSTIDSSAVPLPTAAPEIALASTPVAQNAAWTPIERDFEGVAMVLVPAGCFMMGSENGEDREKPAHEQYFATPFWIDKYEVTNAQFVTFEGIASTSSQWIGGNHPREQITWLEARDYCDKREARLPTEREWEYAARGPDNLIYPWGDEWAPNYVIQGGNSDNTVDVGNRPLGASWVGAQDMAGNVWEWVSSWYKPYPYDADDGREAEVSNETNVQNRVLRGGSLNLNDPDYFRAASRGGFTPDLGCV